MNEERIIKNVNENQDSLTLGTAKGGAIKVYFDSSKEEEAKIRIECAIRLRTFALEEFGK